MLAGLAARVKKPRINEAIVAVVMGCLLLGSLVYGGVDDMVAEQENRRIGAEDVQRGADGVTS